MNWEADAGVISMALIFCFPVEDDFLVSSSSRIMDLESPKAALISNNLSNSILILHSWKEDQYQSWWLTIQISQCRYEKDIKKHSKSKKCPNRNPIPIFFHKHASHFEKNLSNCGFRKCFVLIWLQQGKASSDDQETRYYGTLKDLIHYKNLLRILTTLHLSSRNSFRTMAFCPYIMGEI